MPIQYPEDGGARAVFAGRCEPEEADALLDWLRRTPDAEADLAACGDLHTSLAQLLIAGRVRLTAPPADGVLTRCLHAAGLVPAAAAAVAPKSLGTRKPPKPGSSNAQASWPGLSGPPLPATATTGGPDKPGRDAKGHEDAGTAHRPKPSSRARPGRKVQP